MCAPSDQHVFATLPPPILHVVCARSPLQHVSVSTACLSLTHGRTAHHVLSKYPRFVFLGEHTGVATIIVATLGPKMVGPNRRSYVTSGVGPVSISSVTRVTTNTR